MWGLEESTTTIQCDEIMDVDPLPDGYVILSHVEKLSLGAQKRLVKLLDRRKVPVVAVTLNKDGVEPNLYRYLANKYWFRQPYNPAISWNHENIKPLQNAQTTQETIKEVRLMSHEVKMIPDVHRYIYDIVVFVRFHRMVVGGLPTESISDVTLFVKFLSRIMGYSYVVPTVVQLGAKKILPLRIRLQTKPEQEPSMRWGSDLSLVRQMMSMWDVDSVVEDVLSRVTPPI